MRTMTYLLERLKQLLFRLQASLTPVEPCPRRHELNDRVLNDLESRWTPEEYERQQARAMRMRAISSSYR